LACKPLQVASRAKHRAFTGDHHAADVGVVFSGIQRLNARGVNVRAEGVLELRIADREDERAALAGTL
jgi:hypothetical protein